MTKNIKILISGTTGFLGNALINHFQKKYHVYALSRRKSEIKKSYPVFVPNDWDNSKLLSKTMEGMDAFVHCAGLAHGKAGDMIMVNHDLTMNLAKAALKANLPHFIFISSVAVLGQTGHFDITAQPNPYNDYALSKLKAEQDLYRLFKGTNTILTIIRPPMIIGRDAPGHGATIRKIIQKNIPLPFSGLKAMRSYVTLGRLINVIEESVNNKASSLIHISSGEVSAADLIRIIAGENDMKATLFYVPTFFFKIIALYPPMKIKLFPLLHDHVVLSESISLDR